MEQEGVIKFKVEHQWEAPRSSRWEDVASALMGWREVLFRVGLIGADPRRYGGAGFGNVSMRLPPFTESAGARPFLITGSKSGGLDPFTPEALCEVVGWSAQKNEVRSRGPALPSSESITHGAVYDVAPQLRAVFHGHSPEIWHRAKRLGLPSSRKGIAYGTPEMAWEVRRLWRETTLSVGGVFVMGGHEDGVIALGRSPSEAGTRLIDCLAKACQAM